MELYIDFSNRQRKEKVDDALRLIFFRNRNNRTGRAAYQKEF